MRVCLNLQVTQTGEFVFPLDSPHKKPYEVLVLGRHRSGTDRAVRWCVSRWCLLSSISLCCKAHCVLQVFSGGGASRAAAPNQRPISPALPEAFIIRCTHLKHAINIYSTVIFCYFYFLLSGYTFWSVPTLVKKLYSLCCNNIL